MAEYIDKEATLSLVKPDTPEDEKAAVTIATVKKLFRSIIQRAPAADVAPVRHAKWVDNHCTACGMMPMGDEMWKNCDFDSPRFEKFMDYCPNCGAKMIPQPPKGE